MKAKPHPLTEYRKAHDLTLEAFAAQIGASKSMVWKWENGAAEPRPHYRKRIVEVTKGSISLSDLLPMDAAPRKRKAA